MGTFISHSPAETESLGESWGNQLSSGRAIGLCGELGAGKTQLVKGLARGLGIRQRVHSPTFSLINIYTGGRLLLFHLDLYRLDTREQFLSAGLDEYLSAQGVAVIEWAEKLYEMEGQRSESEIVPESLSTLGLSGPLRWVRIDTLSETARRITYEDFGA